MSESKYITIVNGLGEKTVIPRAGLEHYKKQMAEFLQRHKEIGGSKQGEKFFEIKEIIEE